MWNWNLACQNKKEKCRDECKDNLTIKGNSQVSQIPTAE
jgi:hypothetical protein